MFVYAILLTLNGLSKQQHKHYLLFMTLYLASTKLPKNNVNGSILKVENKEANIAIKIIIITYNYVRQ